MEAECQTAKLQTPLSHKTNLLPNLSITNPLSSQAASSNSTS